jgi:hypothetical protein
MEAQQMPMAMTPELAPVWAAVKAVVVALAMGGTNPCRDCGSRMVQLLLNMTTRTRARLHHGAMTSKPQESQIVRLYVILEMAEVRLESMGKTVALKLTMTSDTITVLGTLTRTTGTGVSAHRACQAAGFAMESRK